MGATESKSGEPIVLELEVEQSRHKRKLDWADRGIYEIPESVGTLTALSELDLYSNQLRYIPDCIGSLCNLVKLDLGQNMIKEFPLCICELANLQSLYIQGNHISDIPESFSRLAGSLRTLNLSDNCLSDVPQSLMSMKLLGESEGAKGVLLSGNHFFLPSNRHSWLSYTELMKILEHNVSRGGVRNIGSTAYEHIYDSDEGGGAFGNDNETHHHHGSNVADHHSDIVLVDIQTHSHTTHHD